MFQINHSEEEYRKDRGGYTGNLENTKVWALATV